MTTTKVKIKFDFTCKACGNYEKAEKKGCMGKCKLTGNKTPKDHTCPSSTVMLVFARAMEGAKDRWPR